MIDVDWLDGALGAPEISRTYAEVTVWISGRCATQVEDRRSKSVRNFVLVSAYHFAWWIASRWWRLRYEPSPISHRSRSLDWRLSHELASAGEGYIWPPLVISGYGQGIITSCHPSGASPDYEPVRYLAEFGNLHLDASEFEQGVADFVKVVLARLDSEGLETELHELWSVLLGEWDDPTFSAFRRREALLGYDPGDAPDSLVDFLATADGFVGATAVDEIAAAAQKSSQEVIWNFRSRAANAPACRMREVGAIREAWANKEGMAPWRQGVLAARIVRNAWEFGTNPITIADLAKRLDVDGSAPFEIALGPVSAGIRDENNPDTLRILLASKNTQGQRFSLSRVLGDYLFLDEHDNWRPVTQMRTRRQQFQRAFAAEFLCPIDILRARLEQTNFDEDDIGDAAQYFDVSPLVIQHQLVNAGVLLPSDVLKASEPTLF